MSLPIPGRSSVSFHPDRLPVERTSSASTAAILDSSFSDSNSTSADSQQVLHQDDDNDKTTTSIIISNSNSNHISNNINKTEDNDEDSSDDMDDFQPNLEFLHKHPPSPPSPLMYDPMSPERRARKQRLRPCASRRGGACHSDLLKSAVLATLESYESEPESTGHRRSASTSLAGDERSRGSANTIGLMDDNSRSSRKRARQQWDGGNDYDQHKEQHAGVLDDCLLGAMDICTISTRASVISHSNQSLVTNATDDDDDHHNSNLSSLQSTFVPIRHVARRTSKELASGVVPSPRTKRVPQRHMLYDD